MEAAIFAVISSHDTTSGADFDGLDFASPAGSLLSIVEFVVAGSTFGASCLRTRSPLTEVGRTACSQANRLSSVDELAHSLCFDIEDFIISSSNMALVVNTCRCLYLCGCFSASP